MRLYVRLYTQPSPPSDDEVAREVHEYALARLPQAGAAAPEREMAGVAVGTDDRNWGIIEID